MRVVTDVNVEKSARKAVQAGIEQLTEHLRSVEGQNIQCLPNSTYLIHERYYVHKEFFFTYKLKTENNQLRLLLWFDQDNQSIVLIAYFIKKQTHSKYYNEFQKYAESFYNKKIR